MPPDTDGRSGVATGILLVIAAGFMLASQDALGKHLATHYGVIQTVWARFTVHAVLVFIWLAVSGPGLGFLRARHPGLQLVRSVLMVTVTGLMYTALRVVPLADATAVLFFAPVLVTVMAAPVLGEALSRHRIAAVITGFVGVLLVVRPGLGMDPHMLLPVAGAVTLAGYLLLTRYIGARDHQRATLFYTTACGCLLLSAIVPWHWQPPTPGHAAAMLAMGSLGALGHGAYVLAFARTQASVLSPFLYSQIMAASVLSVGIFGDPLRATTVAGATLLVVGGLVIWWRERGAGQREGLGQPLKGAEREPDTQ